MGCGSSSPGFVDEPTGLPKTTAKTGQPVATAEITLAEKVATPVKTENTSPKDMTGSDIFSNASAVNISVTDFGSLQYLGGWFKSEYGPYCVFDDRDKSVYWKVTQHQGGYLLSISQSGVAYYISNETVSSNGGPHRYGMQKLVQDVSKALVFVPVLAEHGTYILKQAGTNLVLTLDTRGYKVKMANLQTGVSIFQHFILAIKPSNWSLIGESLNFESLEVADGDQIFGTYISRRSSGDVLQYVGTGWIKVTDSVQSLAGNDDGLYVIPHSKDKVLGRSYLDTGWKKIGLDISLNSLSANENVLLGLNSSQIAFSFVDGEWKNLGSPPLLQIAASSNHICGIDTSKNIQHYTGNGWVCMNRLSTELIHAGNALYSVNQSGSLERFNANDQTWTIVSGPAASFHGLHASLFKMLDDGVYNFVNDEWHRIGGPMDSFTVGSNCLFGTIEDNVYLLYPDLVEGGNHNVELLSTTSGGGKWIFEVQVSNKYFSGFDGEIEIAMFHGTTQSRRTLPITHFVRGKTYVFDINFSMIGLDSISMRGERNFWEEHLTIDRVTAYSNDTGKVYTFDFNCDVPLGGYANRKPSSVVDGNPIGGAIIHVWAYRGINTAVGHASLSLTNGTYISWWPGSVNFKQLPFLPLTFSANGVAPANLAQDTALEYQPPDTSIRIPTINETAVDNWWASFKTPGKKWNVTSQNCSTTVFDALKAGGALNMLSARQQANYNNMIVWTPNDILQLARDMLAAGHS